MQKVKIEDIENAKGKNLQVNFKDFIDGVQSDGAIKATLDLTSLGEFIEVTGQVEGTVILECDLCLEEFKYELDFKVDELYAKNTLLDEYAQETELKEGQFVTDLRGSQDIDICDLLYQSVILDFPNKKVCGINCKGDKFLSEGDFSQSEVDPRLAIFRDIELKT